MSNEPQPQNDIVALRTTLFDTLRALGDKDKPMDIDRAKAVNEIAQTIINSAKVEVDALKIIGGNGSGFIPANLPKPEQRPALQNLREKGILPETVRPGISHPQPGLTVHKMRG